MSVSSSTMHVPAVHDTSTRSLPVVSGAPGDCQVEPVPSTTSPSTSITAHSAGLAQDAPAKLVVAKAIDTGASNVGSGVVTPFCST